MKTIRNILLGLVALTIGVSITAEAQNNKLHKKQKTGDRWISVGPGNLSGRVLAVHVDNKNPQKIYVGTAGGGLWISTNDGVSWSHCVDYPGSVAISAIVQDADGKIYIGTGEAYGLADPGVETNITDFGIEGNGIYFTDNDVDFTLISTSDNYKVINNLVYNPIDNSIYIGTEQGLKVYSINQNNLGDVVGTDSKMVTDLDIGTDGSILYSCYAGGTAEVFLKQPSSTSFTSMCGTSSSKLPADAGRISIAIASTNSDVMYAYATNKDERETAKRGHFQGVYKTVDKGNTWEKIYAAPTYEGPSGNPLKTSGLGQYCNNIAISPTSESTVFVGTTFLYEGIDMTSPGGNTLYSWMPVLYGALYSINYTNKGFFIGTSNGLYRYTDKGASFTRLNRYLNNSQIYSFSVGNENQILLNARDNGYVYLNNPTNSYSQGISLTSSYGSGINSALSMIKSEALFYADITGTIYRMASVNSDVQKPSQWYGNFAQLRDSTASTKLSTKEFARWYNTSLYNLSGLTNSPLFSISPIVFWESTHDNNSIDVITYLADKTYLPGEDICARSQRNAYPIWIKNGIDTLYKDSTISIKDNVTSRFFLGGGPYKYGDILVGAPVYMTTGALDFNTAIGNEWICVFRTKDTTEQVIDMLPSKDGNHLFILTRKIRADEPYSIYRVSGFDTYRKKEELEVANAVLADNPLRMLKNDTLLNESELDNMTLKSIMSIALDPQDNNRLFLTNNASEGMDLENRIYLITNALTATLGTVSSSNKTGTGLPDGPVYTGIIEMTADNNGEVAFVGTEKGVYKTTNLNNSNPTWIPYNMGIEAEVPVFKLLQQTLKLENQVSVYYNKLGERTETVFPGVQNTGIIYAATHGLGMFIYDEYHQPVSVVSPKWQTPINNTLKVYPNPTSNFVTIEFSLPTDEQVQVNIVDITGKVLLSNNIGSRNAGKNSEILDCSNLPAGIYFVNVKTNTQNKAGKIVVTK